MKNPFRKITFGILIGCLGLAVVPMRSLAQSQSDHKATDEERDEQHGLLFNDVGDFTLRGTVPAELVRTSRDLVITGFEDGDGSQMLDPNAPPYPPPVYVGMVCSSDLVVLGTASGRKSHMSQNQRFIYTDWSFTVDEVLKNNAKAPVQTDADIIVVRPGGRLIIDNRNVDYVDQSFKDFQSGQHYLLGLTYLPKTQDYLGVGKYSYLLSGSNVVNLAWGTKTWEAKGADVLQTDMKAAAVWVAADGRCKERETVGVTDLKAQAISKAKILGTVSDSSKRMVAGATITMKNRDTGMTNTTVTDSQGRYTVPDLINGTYELDVEATGYKESVQGNIKLIDGSLVVMDVTLLQ